MIYEISLGLPPAPAVIIEAFNENGIPIEIPLTTAVRMAELLLDKA